MRHALETTKTIALDAPSALEAELAGKRVEDRVDIGRNVQPPPFDIVTGVDDDGQVVGSNLVMQTLNEFCAASAAGENDDHLRCPRITMIVGGGEKTSGEESTAINYAGDEFWIYRQALAELLASGFRAAAAWASQGL